MPLVHDDGPGRDAEGPERRRLPRDEQGLIEALAAEDALVRRRAARELVMMPGAVAALLDRVSVEPDASVRHALFTTLGGIGGEQALEGLIALLRSDSAALRNGALEQLQTLPDAFIRRAATLLADPDPDVRLLTVNTLALLDRPGVEVLLRQVVRTDEAVNVGLAAVEALMEVGGPDARPDLEAMARRFADEPFVAFAVRQALGSIDGDG